MLNKNIGFLVLAAGSSRRFGSQKLAAILPTTQKPLLISTLDSIRAAVLDAPIWVICCEAEIATVKIAQDWVNTDKHAEIKIMGGRSEGLGHSIAFGVKQASHWDGWWLCLGDMPYIQPETYQYLMTHLEKHNLEQPLQMAPSLKISEGESQRGHPVFFSDHYLESLSALTEDRGAALLFDDHFLQLLPCDDHGVIADIDSPQSLSCHF